MTTLHIYCWKEYNKRVVSETNEKRGRKSVRNLKDRENIK
jgi:hypothetical protein